jgi:hypothetical protein
MNDGYTEYLRKAAGEHGDSRAYVKYEAPAKRTVSQLPQGPT